MGKIRVATLEDETKQQAQKEQARVKREQKKIRAGVEVKEEKVSKASKETKKPEAKKPTTENPPRVDKRTRVEAGRQPKTVKKSPKTAKPKKVHSKSYKQALALVDRKKLYPGAEAITLVKQTATTKFVGSIEAHFNLNKKIAAKNSDTLKVERKAPLAHGKLGKVNEKTEELEKKLNDMIKTVGANSITKLTLSSSMGPGVKVMVEK